MFDAIDVSYDGAPGDVQPHAIAVETPVNFIFGSIPFAVMMASPSDLEDFAYGFSFTEGIIDAPEDIREVSIEDSDGAIRVSVTLNADRMQRHLGRSRSLAGRTGCGVCGIADLADMPQAAALESGGGRFDPHGVARALRESHELQALNMHTRAVHGAAFCDGDGAVIALREDVGRHNALDKLIGSLLRAGVKGSDGFVLITSRASFEMIEKTVRFGAPALVAISAPTSLAIDRARAYGLTLIAVARDDGAILFAPETVAS
ncbi:MAG: formate dehydrogenase accessory sulfurtransferase FdhD [Hyphomicrobiales bacterium]|nr:formate dehydrogenase accessory sulfurtransferase FdhD [Hyphomicrobiales bacterium]